MDEHEYDSYQDQVDLVDSLMTQLSMGATPSSDELNRAVELGLNIQEIELVAGGVYAIESEDVDDDDYSSET